MRKSRSWKDNTKSRNIKRYGKRNIERYSSPFMLLDEVLFGKEEER